MTPALASAHRAREARGELETPGMIRLGLIASAAGMLATMPLGSAHSQSGVTNEMRALAEDFVVYLSVERCAERRLSAEGMRAVDQEMERRLRPLATDPVASGFFRGVRWATEQRFISAAPVQRDAACHGVVEKFMDMLLRWRAGNQ